MIKKIILITTLLLSEILFAGGNIGRNLGVDGGGGGMDSGGGGTLPTQPASIYDIQDIAQESKPVLLYLLNSYEWLRKYDQEQPYYKKLFSGNQKAQEVLKDLRLEVRLDKPCFTSNGTEVDASIYGLKPNTICLSAFRIAPKLDKAIAKREVQALLMHEVSHFLGATEEEATKFQQEISWLILNSKEADNLNGDVIRDRLDNFELLLSSSIDSLNKSDLITTGQELASSLVELNNFNGVATTYTYKLFNFQEDQYQDLLRLKLIWAYNFLNTLISGEEQKYDIDKYNKRFLDREYFFAHEEMGWDKKHIYRNEKISKLHNVNELIQLLISLKSEYEIRSAYAYQVTFGMHWMNLNGHLTTASVNPWLNYLGTYVVEAVQCDLPSQFDNEIKFVVENTGAGLFFRKIYSSASLSDRIELGAYNVNAYLNNLGVTNDGSVYMTHEMGGSWSAREFADSQRSNIILRKTENNKFELVRTTLRQPKDVTKPDFKNMCIFAGSIQ